jgi:hypothetical protein
MSEFGSAFKAARAAGKKTFDFKGKSYTTELKEEKAGRVAKTATRKFAANAVPGRRQTKPKMGGGAAPTPARSPSKERRGAGAIGRGGKDPVLPPKKSDLNKPPITLGKLAKAGAKGALTGAAMAGGAGAARAGAGMAGRAAEKGILSGAKKMFPPRMKPKEAGDVIARVGKPRPTISSPAKTTATPKRVEKAKKALKRKQVTAGEASDMAMGFKRGGKA